MSHQNSLYIYWMLLSEVFGSTNINLKDFLVLYILVWRSLAQCLHFGITHSLFSHWALSLWREFHNHRNRSTFWTIHFQLMKLSTLLLSFTVILICMLCWQADKVLMPVLNVIVHACAVCNVFSVYSAMKHDKSERDKRIEKFMSDWWRECLNAIKNVCSYCVLVSFNVIWREYYKINVQIGSHKNG